MAACRQRLLLSTVETSKTVEEPWQVQLRQTAALCDLCLTVYIYLCNPFLLLSVSSNLLSQDQIAKRSVVATDAHQSCKRWNLSDAAVSSMGVSSVARIKRKKG